MRMMDLETDLIKKWTNRKRRSYLLYISSVLKFAQVTIRPSILNYGSQFRTSPRSRSSSIQRSSSMANKSKQNQTGQKQMNPYEKRRQSTVEQNKEKLRDFGIKSISDSLTSLVSGKKTIKKRVKPANANANDMDYSPGMEEEEDDDDNESDHQQVTTKSKKRQQYVAPMSIKKFGNLMKQHRVFAPKKNQSRTTHTMAELISSTKGSQRQKEVLNNNVTKPNYTNFGLKRQSHLVDEDDDEYDETIHQDANGEYMELDGLEDDENEEDRTKAQDTVCETEQEIGNRTTNKKRGITCGKGARKIMRTSKKRLPVEFDYESLRVISANESAFTFECGYIVRNNCSIQFKDWRLVPNEVKLSLHHKLTTLFDIDVENPNICKVINSYMARALRFHRAQLHRHFKKIEGLNDPYKGKTTPPPNVRKADWEYLCDRWCDTKFLEIAKKRVAARKNRKMDSRNGSKSTIRYHLESGRNLNSLSGQIETWRVTHWDAQKGWISTDAAKAYEDMMKLRKQHSVESMSDKLIIEKVLGRSSVRLHGWGRDPTVGSNTMGTNRKPKGPYDELKDAFEKLKDTCAIMQQALIENNIMSSLPSTREPFQGDTSECDENVGDTSECDENVDE